MTSQILLPKNFDANKLTMSDPKGPDNKAKNVYINYSGDRLVFQTPEMPLPFGVSKWDNEGKTPPKYSVDLSFKDKNDDPRVAKFFDMLSALDEAAIQTACKNKATWFKGKKYSDEMVRNIYTPIIKWAKDKVTKEPTDAYPPTYKVVLPFNDKDKCITTKVYNDKREAMDLMDLENANQLATATKGARAAVIVHVSGVWISNTGFGITSKAMQVRLKPPTTIKEHAFIEDEDEDDVNNGDEQQDVDVDENKNDKAQPAAKTDAAAAVDDDDDLDPPPQ